VTGFVVEHDFVLPKGYVSEQGTLHRDGTMRLATAADEILLLQDPRVQKLPAYLIVLLLSRVVTRLGTLPEVNAGIVEGLFAEDLAFLQSLYNEINGLGGHDEHVTCPNCEYEFVTEVVPAGGS